MMFERSRYKLARILLHMLQIVAALTILDGIAFQFGYAVVLRIPEPDIWMQYLPTLLGVGVGVTIWAVVQMQIALLDLADSNREILAELRKTRQVSARTRHEPVFQRDVDAPPRATR